MGAADVEVPSRRCKPRGLLKSALEVRIGEAPQGLTAPHKKTIKTAGRERRPFVPSRERLIKTPLSMCFSAH